MVVEHHENVLGVAAVDAVAVSVEDVRVDEVGPRIDAVVLTHAPADADGLLARGYFDLEPDLVRVRRALREEMSEFQGPDDGLEKIRLTGNEVRNSRA